jgi:hypothetical protein
VEETAGAICEVVAVIEALPHIENMVKLRNQIKEWADVTYFFVETVLMKGHTYFLNNYKN